MQAVTPVQAADSVLSESYVEFVKLDPLILPIIDSNGINQVVSLVVSLEVSSINDAEKVRKMKPKLTDSYIQNMYGMLNEQVALQDGVLQVALIKRRLVIVTKEIMGDDIVHDVLLQVVQQRPI
ncbi:MAG: hypothetical protein OEY94_05835 [Alphaproteobacteria bacterium]|nr:hypothetical protein [Alphaproteobacteria bacterium]